MKNIGNILDAICAVFSGASLVSLIGIYFAESMGRQISMPIPGGQEAASLLFSCFIFSSIPIVVRESGHISVGLLVDSYPAIGKKIEKVFTGAAELLLTSLLVYLVYDYAGRQARIGQITAYHKIPYAPFVYLGSAFALIALYFVLEHHLLDRSNTKTSNDDKDQVGTNE